MRNYCVCLGIVGCALLLTGCFFPAERGLLLEARVQTLARENETLSEEARERQERLNESQERISRALGQTEQWARQSGADIGVQMQRSAEEIAQLRGNIELLEHRIQELEAAQVALRAQLHSVGESELPVVASPTTSTPAGTRQPTKPNEPKAFLKHAEETLAKKDMEGGRALLNEFLRRWPKDSAAGEVHFKLGETYFAQKHYREALYEYGKVIQEFPKTTAAPLTYLRSSECFKQLKKMPESKLALQELQRIHPKSAEAKKAAELLKNIENSEKKKSGRTGKSGR